MWSPCQIIHWALQRECSFRSGPSRCDPDVAVDQLRWLQDVGRNEAEGRVFEEFVLYGSRVKDFAGQEYMLPQLSYRISRVLCGEDTWPQAKRECSACEANVLVKGAVALAGCHGKLTFDLSLARLEPRLQAVVDQLELQQQLRAVFPRQQSVWQSLWAQSPLTAEQQNVLRRLLPALHERRSLLGEASEGLSERELSGVFSFLDAVDVSQRYHLPLHVKLHSHDVPTGSCCCVVEADDDEESVFNLKLSDAEYTALERRYLASQGCTEPQADEIFEKIACKKIVGDVGKVRYNQYCSREAAKRKSAKSESRPWPKQLKLDLKGVGLDVLLVEPAEGRVSQRFYISPELITQEQWSAAVDSNPLRSKDRVGLSAHALNWLDCQAFCESLSRMFERMIRLPSEAEWELARWTGSLNIIGGGESALPEWLEDGGDSPYELTVGDNRGLVHDDHRKAHRLVRCFGVPSRRFLRIDGSIPFISSDGTSGPRDCQSVKCGFRVVCEVI